MNNIATQWKAILDVFRRAKNERHAEYCYGPFETLYEQLDAKALADKAARSYEDALDACLDGQDPILWKLSYDGH